MKSVAAVSALLVTLVGAAGCGDDQPREGRSGDSTASASNTASPSTSGSPTPAAPHTLSADGPPQFDFTRSKTIPEPGVQRALVAGDLVLTLTGGVTGYQLPSLHRAWAVEPSSGFAPQDVWLTPDKQTGYLLAARANAGKGTRVGSDSFEVTVFDTATGKVRNQGVVTARRSSTAPPLAAAGRVVGLFDRRLVIDTAPFGATDPEHTTLVVSLAGKPRTGWVRHNAAALAVGGGVTLINTGRPGAAGELAGVRPNGKVAWRALTGNERASLIGVSHGAAVILHSVAFGAPEVVAVRLKNGKASKPVTGIADGQFCVQASRTTAVCNTSANELVSWDLTKPELRWKLPTRSRYAPLMTSLYHGWVIAGSPTGQPVLLSARTGAESKVDPGVAVNAVSRWGGFRLDQGRLTFVPAGAAPKGAPSPTQPAPSAPTGETPGATANS